MNKPPMLRKRFNVKEYAATKIWEKKSVDFFIKHFLDLKEEELEAKIIELEADPSLTGLEKLFVRAARGFLTDDSMNTTLSD
ncbi:hypothetical protein FHW36_1185 [Chitinophaga polysaccharea]|uniref:Uncharacterized protein n=1 Tax=Chitinophaga polysaccharea TaxID=1293035 RepID=A0A561P0P8_9BACT|nr:hypothetical protein [Chitinophaga polysaccharea]TWF31711.1 hypothetical protein FHW36_1185 [Chitinophaga polysaccharea]